MRELALGSGIIFRMADGHNTTPHETAEEQALAERVRATGDADAFAALALRYRRRLTGLVRRMLQGQFAGVDETDDIVQEVFVAAYDKRLSFRQGEPFRPWLYRIAINRCLDRLRRQGRRPLSISWELAEEPGQSADDPLTQMLSDERDMRLQQEIGALPPHHRAVFLLRHADDLSYEEIASAMQMPVGTVKTHLFRARAQLRQALSGYLEP